MLFIKKLTKKEIEEEIEDRKKLILSTTDPWIINWLEDEIIELKKRLV